MLRGGNPGRVGAFGAPEKLKGNLEIKSPEIRRRFQQFHAKLPSCRTFVSAPNDGCFAGNLVGEVDEAHLLSHAEALRHDGKAALWTDVLCVAHGAQNTTGFRPFNSHRNSRIETSRAANVPHSFFKANLFGKRHAFLLSA